MFWGSSTLAASGVSIMHMSITQLFVVLGQPLLQCAIVWIMIQRRLRAQFPIFFNYTVFGILTVVLGLFVFYEGSQAQYYYTYWSLTACGTLLAFGALYEVLRNMLKPYPALRDLGKLLMVWVGAFLLLAATVTVLVNSGEALPKVCAAILLQQRILRLIECGLLLLIVALQSRLGLSWRSYGLSIALGLGSFALVDLAMVYAIPRFPAWATELNIAHAMALDCIIGAWIVNFVLPQPARNSLTESPARIIFQRWNDVLGATPLVSRRGEVIAMSPVESFLPGVERTVERVMARKMTQ
jgi:hypothetical protein